MSIREIISAVFIFLGISVFVLSTLGLFRYRYVLNRMHIAAQSDTLGLLMIFIGAAINLGFTFATLKLFMILAFYWVTGPVSSHVVAKMELGSLEPADEDKFRIEDRE